MEFKDSRKQALIEWLDTLPALTGYHLQKLPGDASFRRYFRISTKEGSYIAMDAPPDKENVESFIAFAEALRQQDVKTPVILKAQQQAGFLLLSDFGDETFLRILNAQNADLLYEHALRTLSRIQGCRQVEGRVLPEFTAAFMWQEWQWHKEWFLNKLLGLSFATLEPKLDAALHCLIDAIDAQPKVFMHRDYHSANLMRLTGNQVGVLDFQDAFLGPVTYDLASLLRDCYIDWPEQKVRAWAIRYGCLLRERNVLDGVNEQTFLHWFDWMSIERHLKALFTFARKALRDQQMQYLDHVPRTLNYICSVSANYPLLAEFHHFYHHVVTPTFEKETRSCAL